MDLKMTPSFKCFTASQDKQVVDTSSTTVRALTEAWIKCKGAGCLSLFLPEKRGAGHDRVTKAETSPHGTFYSKTSREIAKFWLPFHRLGEKYSSMR